MKSKQIVIRALRNKTTINGVKYISMADKVKSTDYLRQPCSKLDPEMWEIIKAENNRQKHGLELIASENFTCTAVMDVLGSCLTDKYSEGYVGARYYGGTEHIDKIESLCMSRALNAFRLNPQEWGVNVQPYSGSPANFAVFTGVVGPHGRIMGLDLPDGGHLTHGFYTPTRKVSATSVFFESFPYSANPETGLIDYDALERDAMKFRPKLIIAGMSCYARNIDYRRMKEIATKCGALLHADMAHISGLVAAGVVPGPFEYCDIVTTTTHKTLRGSRAGMIFYRVGSKGFDKQGNELKWDLKKKIDEALFPGLQGGPHNNAIAGVAVAMKLAAEQPFKEYSQQVMKNAVYLAKTLTDKGLKLVTGGTDNHLMLIDMRSAGVDGNRVNAVCDRVHIACNKNTVPGDKSAMRPSGIRLGTPALTSRGMVEEDMEVVADLFYEAVVISQKCKKSLDQKATFKDYKDALDTVFKGDIEELGKRVSDFASSFPIPGKTYQ